MSASLLDSPRPPDEASDTPFWISFADLMTALMMLFLLVMTVSLLTLTRATDSSKAKSTQAMQSTQAAEALMDRVEAAALRVPGVRVDRSRHVIDFGDQARFDTASHVLSADAARKLRRFVVELLDASDEDSDGRVLERVVVEGFADPRGTYLMNLNLSMQRAQRVLCALLDPKGERDGVSLAQRVRIRELFSVGGFSFNELRETNEASRRIELRLEFKQPATGDQSPATKSALGRERQELGECALDRAS
jgi:outer membrane protein OmpA-like peptidoglycan-associated protein